jgi:hypothetical protein
MEAQEHNRGSIPVRTEHKYLKEASDLDKHIVDEESKEHSLDSNENLKV